MAKVLCYRLLLSLTTAVMTPAFGQSFPQTANNDTPTSTSSGTGHNTNSDAVPEVIVTAQKREQRLQDVGLTVTAVGAEELANKRVSTLADLAQAVPGLIYTQSQNNTPVYTLRGVGFFESSLAAYPDVSTYIDQAPLPLPVTSTLTLFDLERVEVLKGPQGTLFGNNATGGAINFIAAKPSSEFGSGETIGYGRFNTFDFDGYVTGPLSSTVNARLAAKVTRGDDWQRSYTTDASSGKVNNTALRMLLDWNPNDLLKISFNLNGWLNYSDPLVPQYYRLTPQNAPGAPGPFGTNVPTNLPIFSYPTAPRDARAADFSPTNVPSSHNTFWQGAFRGDYKISDSVTLTSLTSYLQTRIQENLEYDGTTLEAYDLAGHAGKVKSVSQELRLAGTGQGAMRWVFGGNYERTTADDAALNLSGDSTSAFINGSSLAYFYADQKMVNYAGFGNIEYDLNHAFTLKGGVRYTKAKRSTVSGNTQPTDRVDPYALGFNNFFNIIWNSLSAIYPNFTPVKQGDSFVIDNRLKPDGTPLNPATYGTAGNFYGELDESNVSWSVGADFKPTDEALLYANVSKGYKAGSFPLVSAATWSQQVGISQESLVDYEVGFKTQAFNRRLTTNGAAFFYDYRNKQLRANIVDGIFGLLNGLVNVPKSRVMGAELEMTYRPERSLALSLSGTYLDAKVREYNGIVGAGVDPATGLRVPIFQSYEGAQLPFSPKVQLAASAHYTMEVSSSWNAFVGGDITHQSKSFGVLAVTSADKSNYEVPSRTLVGLNAGLEAPDNRWRLTVWGRNIFNEYYTLNSILAYDGIVRYAGRPAEYGVSFSYQH
jgi:outer membrane receptor protein involved in Fe transport